MQKMEPSDQKAMQLLRDELGSVYKDETYEQLKLRIFRKRDKGYTGYYMKMTVDYDKCETRAKKDVIIKLARVDLAKGTLLEEIVTWCCHYAPIQPIIKEVIKLGGGDMKERVERIMKWRYYDGLNCLMLCYQILVSYKNKGHKPDTTPMKLAVVITLEYLIKLGIENEIGMDEVINATTKSGQTLFRFSSTNSEHISLLLIAMHVKVNSIDNLFTIPSFEFRWIRDYMLEHGANPFVLNYTNKTEQQLCNLQLYPTYLHMPKSIFHTIDPIKCQCQRQPCSNPFKSAWYYTNGVFDGKFKRVIGKGGEGVVVEGEMCGIKVVFKFVRMKEQEFKEKISDGLAELRKRLNEARQYDGTQSDLIVQFYGHFRQQVHYNDHVELAKMLGIEPNQTMKYEVFITKKCAGNLRDLKKQGLNHDHRLSIVQQMLQMLKHLKSLEKCHNDIKPGNLLFNKVPTVRGTETGSTDGNNRGFDVHLQLADFGMCNQLGGTPGWSPADFTNNREPGMSDLYSVGLVILFLLCEDDDLFYSLRDNFVETVNSGQTKRCVFNFRSLREIQLIRWMIHPVMKCRIKLDDCITEWNNIQFDMITRQRLIQCGVDRTYLTLRNGTLKQKNDIESKLISMSIMPLTSISTRTHLQGDDEYCWLYSLATSIHKALLIKSGTLETISDPAIKQAAIDFLRKPNFHQILRNEILFGLTPTTLNSCQDQRQTINYVTNTLLYGGFLRQYGLKSLATVIAFEAILNEELKFECKTDYITNFFFTATILPTGGDHIVTLKGLLLLADGEQKLLIRDSARDADQSGEVWLENKITHYTDKLNLAGDVCMYFTC